ncbi:MAG: DNA replication/repair protein RecF [Firmicutes bacterium]|nr:DNA replication/repair protein RecF [Bacillota bacterium]MDY3658778.1 DNA replication/repair protein RecF [Eubacteriales bacterium]
MKVLKLKLSNFRNYDTIDVSFSSGTNIILGKNAQGKTNLLEAIFMCAIGKSLRAKKDSDLVKWGMENGKIELEVEKKFGKSKIEIYLFSKGKKAIKINSLPIKRIGELLGELRCVFFAPDELKLIKESPEDRRRFMDIDLSQISKAYFNLLGKYEKIISSRNKLLKDYKDKNSLKKSEISKMNFEELKSMISIYNLQLAECASKITISRNNLIVSLAPFAQKAHSYLTDNKENLEIEYQGSFTFPKELVSIENDFQTIKNKFISAYEKSFEKDVFLGYTTVGPHRDDIKVTTNGIDVKSFGSQGQQRTAALSLKLAELEIIKQQTGDMPILILDDVLSELDVARRTKLLKFCSLTQTFISSTDKPERIPNSNIIKINNGKKI